MIEGGTLLKRMEVLIDRMRVYSEQMRFDAQRARVERKFTVDFILSVQDLFVDFAKTYDFRQFDKAIAQLKAKEGLRLQIDNWFWRPEPELGLEAQLFKRATYLKSLRYGTDQIWDLLTEYMAGWANSGVNETLLEQVILEAHEHASS